MKNTKMIVGISGHQAREGIDWLWTRAAIKHEISRLGEISEGLSCLADGSDTIFAEEILAEGITLTAVIPIAEYENLFSKKKRTRYLEILSKCKVFRINEDEKKSNEDAFLEAGEYIADRCDILIAVWDGLPSKGKGGTADILKYCLQIRKKVVHINPIEKKTYYK
ncbi:hypothetical protein [Xanthomonas arboricola]|uniref:hypothetical protein n=1 Tax=Xanthomonas arboricola TaxID=56448 RepID=UPI003EBC98F2